MLGDWAATEPFGLPPFSKISPEHFRPAFDAALAEHLAEASAIANSTDLPTFSNTAEALDRSGTLLDRVSNVLSNLCGSNTSPELQVVEGC